MRISFRYVQTFASLMLAAALGCVALSVSASEASDAFVSLGALTGEWEGKFANGRTHRVSYRTSAGGSVLIETWALAPGRESITMYHLDGDDLLATHYCPQGNQPRLRLSTVDGDGTLRFEFKDGSNLGVAGASHQHSMWLRIVDADHFVRSETYIENGSKPPADDSAESEAVRYVRLK